MPISARIYAWATFAAGFTVALWAVARLMTAGAAASPVEFWIYLAFAVFSSQMKVRLPGAFGTLSVNFIFILLTILRFTPAHVVLVGTLGTLVQCLVGARVRPKAIQVAFSVGAVALGSGASALVFANETLRALEPAKPVMLFWTVAFYFLSNTLLVSRAITMADRKPWLRFWYDNFFWTGPQYVIGGCLAALIHATNIQFGWQYLVLVVPGIYLVYHSYSHYLGRLEKEKQQVAEAAQLHLRTIEALALAIEANDETTYSHLRRMQVYAVEIARELGLAEEEVRAVEAAALLHDVGKLAVPDYITNKPGRLTEEEYEKLKIHVTVGAEILESVDFPYPVVPIVRAHHERWDGSGYPEGLEGEQIPMGARILAVIDTLDALASDRRYRKGMPIETALQQIQGESGKLFDPRVVTALEKLFPTLEAKTRAALAGGGRLASQGRLNLSVLEDAPKQAEARQMGFVTSIAAARQEFQKLHEMTHDLGTSLSMGDTLTLMSTRLHSLVPFDGVAIFTFDSQPGEPNTQTLVARHAAGRDADAFVAARLALGEGLSGWVALNRRPVTNGNPAVEFGGKAGHTTLRSAMVVPLEVQDHVIGTLALYRKEPNAFSHDDLRLLLAISAKSALTIENALSFQRAERSAGTDQLTGLPNSASLFDRFELELKKAQATHGTVGVVVIDLDGFKSVNDRFGHLEGNRVLQLAAEGFRNGCRETDFVARMGGDEFVLLLPNISTEAMNARLSAMTSMVQGVGVKVTGEQILSMSAGISWFPLDGETSEALLECADKRMYAIKKLHHQQNPALARKGPGSEGVRPLVN